MVYEFDLEYYSDGTACLYVNGDIIDFTLYLEKEEVERLMKAIQKEEKLEAVRQAERSGTNIPGYDISKRWIGGDTVS